MKYGKSITIPQLVKDATEFVELSQLDAGAMAPEQKARWQKLHSRLFAAGINPDLIDGLVDRAIICKKRGLVESYCDICESNTGKTMPAEYYDLKRELKRLGLSNLDNLKALRRLLGNTKQTRRKADKKKAIRSRRNTTARTDANSTPTISVDDVKDLIEEAIIPYAYKAQFDQLPLTDAIDTASQHARDDLEAYVEQIGAEFDPDLFEQLLSEAIDDHF